MKAALDDPGGGLSGGSGRLHRRGAIGDFDAELRAGARLLDKRDGAAVGQHQFAGDDQAEPGAAGTGRAPEGGKQVLLGLPRHTRTVIVDHDADDAAGPLARDGKIPRRGIGGIGLQGLDGIATQIVDYPE